MLKILDNAVKEEYPILIVAEGIEQDALAPVIRNKLKGVLKAAAIKAPAFGERKSHYLDDIAILTGGSKSRFYISILASVANHILNLCTKCDLFPTKTGALIVT